MSKIDVGARAQNIDIGAEVPAITRVNLAVDSDHIYTAGNDTGRTLEVECPWGTQDMADNILATMSGIQYRPYAAQRALVDPAFEPGDAVSVGGLYSQIINSDITYNGAGLANVEAPDLDELDDEYPAQQIHASSFERQLAYTRSLISKTVGSITLEVTDEDTASTIKLMLGKTEIGSATIALKGEVTFEALGAEPEEGATLINGGWIKAETLNVDLANVSGTLNVENVKLYDSMAVYRSKNSRVVGGRLGYTRSSLDGSAGMHMVSENGYGEVVVTDNGAKMMYEHDGNQIYIEDGSAAVVVDSCWYEFYSGQFVSLEEANLGGPYYMWDTIFANTCECCPSDRNKKNSIEDLPDKYVAMFDNLTPKRFKLNNGKSDRYHVGFISQEVEEAMTASGIGSKEFGGFVKDKDEDGNEIYMLRYSEFIAILVAKVQQMAGEIDRLKERLA